MFYPPKAEAIKKAMRGKGYMVFGGSDYDLNVVGIRTKDMASNQFNDWLGVMYLQDGRWVKLMFPATTDPGLYWRENPMNAKGTALLKPGQYRGAYQIGSHKGAPALVQAADLPVYRDDDRDGFIEADEKKLDTGMFGINIHRANREDVSREVGKWSAGCQVVADPMHFHLFMKLAVKSAERYGDKFTYTLLTEADFK